jgi:hypothetical protein
MNMNKPCVKCRSIDRRPDGECRVCRNARARARYKTNLKSENKLVNYLPNEKWADIIGFEGFYQASNLGRIKGLNRIGGGSDRSCHISERIMTISKPSATVSLGKDGKHCGFHVGHLVLLAFIGEPYEDEVAIHKNGKTNDCRLENLFWGTRSDVETLKILQNRRGVQHHKGNRIPDIEFRTKINGEVNTYVT